MKRKTEADVVEADGGGPAAVSGADLGVAGAQEAATAAVVPVEKESAAVGDAATGVEGTSPMLP